MLSALRFARHSQAVLAQLVRTAAYSACGSALWALLPVIGQRQLGLGAAGVGLPWAAWAQAQSGAGLVLGGIRARFGLEALIRAGFLGFASAMLVAAFVRWPIAVYLALVVAGASWMSVMSTFNTATQTSAPPWVRSRAVSLHVLCALGPFAVGSAIWGALSGLFGLTLALSLAAGVDGLEHPAGPPLSAAHGRSAGRDAGGDDVEDFAIADEPSPEAGPVAVEIAYRIRPDEAAAFLDAASLLRAPRRRDGATFWRLYRDLAEPTRYVERFIVTSWADYLHQRARATLADQELEARVRSFVQLGEAVTLQHYIAER